MENKNTLIALMLMLAVWFGYSLFFQPPPPVSPPAEPQLVSAEVVPAVVPVSSPQLAAVPQFDMDTAGSSQPAPVREVTVENELYRAVFSSSGARLIAFELKNYRQESDLDSPLISLVDPSTFRDSTLNTSGMDGMGFPVDAVYQIDNSENHFKLDGAQQQSLVFSYMRQDGFKIEKTYIFHGDKYAFDLLLNVSNGSQQPVRGSLSLSLLHPWDDAEKGDQFTFVGPVTLAADELNTDDPEDLVKEPRHYGKDVTWSAFEDKYFISAVVPLNGASEKVRIEKTSSSVRNSFESPYIILESGQSAVLSYLLYFGPRDLDVLKEVNYNLDRAIDFGFFSLIATPLLHFLKFFYSFVGNYGVAIIILTVIIKLLFWPLTHKSYASMKHMQKLQPEMQKLREKYKNDREKQNRELMQLYKTHRVNPLGGCLPMLVQIPVFFALYKVLLGAIELRHAPFAFWITDLSLKDPYYVTPLVMGATMFIQQKLTPSTMDPVQAKMFMLMPVIFTFLFLNFPSGLVIYWLVNNLLTILQQYFIHKKA
ncbi:membrane protein insertase YidC [Trichloromonas sp.]|uniref:membrane protein insertase YidC n=1 Tax=Trichloromonas sp. TaxID=3069249 RepID=UPI003D8136E3